MRRRHPVNFLLDCIDDMLHFAASQTKNPSPKLLDPKVLKDLSKLEAVIEEFHTATQSMFKEQKIDAFHLLKQYKKDPSKLSSEQKRFMRKAFTLLLDAAALREAVGRVREEAKLGGTPQKTKKKKRIQHRRKRFKKMGGDEWMRL